MTRNERLEQIMMLLRDGQLVRAQDMAARLGVSERTIWRDMKTLVDYGVPVEGERGLGYVLRRAVALPPLVLSADEMAALQHVLRLAEAHADTRIGTGARSLAAKIRAVMPPEPEEEDESPLAPPGTSG
ncbi:HTH domain-containing protein [Rhodobacter sp. JA431]|uniref:helix-turn-helix transcriptional regulator n=1 Tax=Rhodobacter sp. JA431 TaxID=570013 RepID=UPI000BD7350D|nr:HTH domain-containing protein [Rhodobacter sp. JA431]SOC13115.1 HTH domain-containing protein [Rhodobacter sp. JA431]